MKQIILLSVLLTAFFAFDSAAQLRPAQGQYYQEFSAFKNPSFEQGLAGWELTGDCVHTYTGSVPYLNKALQITCANGSFELKQNITSMTGLAGQIAGISLQGVASASGVTVSSLANDTTLSSQSIPVGATYNRVTLPSFALDGTSNGVKVSASSFTGQVLIDMAQFSLSPHTVIQSVSGTDTDFSPCTITGTWTTNTSYEANCKRDGDVLKVNGKVTVSGGAPDNTALYLALPYGLSIDGGKIQVSNFITRYGDATARDSGVETYPMWVTANSSDLTVVAFSTYYKANSEDYNAARSVLNNSRPFSFGDADTIDFSFEVPIQGWTTGRTSIVQQESQDRTKWTDYTPNLQAGGTNLTFDYLRWKRDGDDVWVEFGGSYTGANSDPTLSIRLPNNERFEYGKIRFTSGYAEFFDSSINEHYPVSVDARNDGTSGYFQILKSGAANPLPTIATGDKISGVMRGTIEGWDVNNVIQGTFTSANMDDSMKRICQTKSLSGNVTATGDISAWTFTNLQLGREFTVKGTPICYGDNTNENTKSCDLRVMNGSAGQVGRAMMLSTGTYERHSMPLRAEFVAADTTVTIEAYTMNNAYLNSAAGVGTRDVTLCMEPKTNVSTTQW